MNGAFKLKAYLSDERGLLFDEHGLRPCIAFGEMEGVISLAPGNDKRLRPSNMGRILERMVFPRPPYALDISFAAKYGEFPASWKGWASLWREAALWDSSRRKSIQASECGGVMHGED